VITRHGKAAGVLIGFDSEDDWIDYRLENEPCFLDRIEAARASLRAGRGVPLEDLDERPAVQPGAAPGREPRSRTEAVRAAHGISLTQRQTGKAGRHRPICDLPARRRRLASTMRWSARSSGGSTGTSPRSGNCREFVRESTNRVTVCVCHVSVFASALRQFLRVAISRDVMARGPDFVLLISFSLLR
jgi:hypothetical protein